MQILLAVSIVSANGMVFFMFIEAKYREILQKTYVLKFVQINQLPLRLQMIDLRLFGFLYYICQ